MYTHLPVHLIPSLREALDGGARQSDGDVEGTVHVVVVVAHPGDLDEGFDHCCSGAGRLTREDLGAHPGGHLELGRGRGRERGGGGEGRGGGGRGGGEEEEGEEEKGDSP